MVAGYGMWLVSRFCGQVGGKREGEGEREKDFKNLLLPCLCICMGEEAALCHSKRHHVVFFFEEKEKKIRSDPKMGYDNPTGSVRTQSRLMTHDWGSTALY